MIPVYRFATPDQWDTCLTAGVVDPLTLDLGGGTDGVTIPTMPDAIAAADDGTLFWVIDGLLGAGDCAGPRIGAVERLVVDRERVWALAADAILAFDRETLQSLDIHPRDGATDLAADGRGGLWLARPDGIARLGGATIPVGDVSGCRIATASGRPALLRAAAAQLILFDDRGAHPQTIALDGLGGFVATDIQSAGACFLLSGTWPAARGGTVPGFVYLDQAGEPIVLGHWHDEAPAAILAGGDSLLALVATSGGGCVVRAFPQVGGAGGRRWLTPVLASDSHAGKWLRAEVQAHLPEGATLSLRWAATRDDMLAFTTRTIAARVVDPVSKRMADIADLLDPLWSPPTIYAGVATDGPVPSESFTVPLHAAAGPLLWVELTLLPNQAAAAASVESLAVRHDGRALIDDLPAIYRSPEGDGDGTMARLVGVLEAMTQAIDAEIGSLADRLDPLRTEDRWLPDLAAMLGIPFDAGLTPAMQRGLMRGARALLSGRGSRAGLVALLDALFPGRPVTIVDRTLLLSPTTLGSTRLPALLAGPSVRVPRLGARLIVGRTALCPVDACDPGIVRAQPEVAVTIPATASERSRFADPVRAMIQSMLPAAVRLRLRWTGWNGGTATGDVLAAPFSPEPVRLGTAGALGAATIAGRRIARLDAGGIAIGHRLP